MWRCALPTAAALLSMKAWAEDDPMSVQALFSPPRVMAAAPAPHSRNAAWLVNYQGWENKVKAYAAMAEFFQRRLGAPQAPH